MSAITRASLWSSSSRKPPNAASYNSETVSYNPTQRLTVLKTREVSGMANFTPGFGLTNMFCVHGLYCSSTGKLLSVAGSSFDSTTAVVPTKQPVGALGYCCNVVHKDARKRDAVGAPTPLTQDHLSGTTWDGKQDMYIESRPVSYFYPMCITPQQGTLADSDWVAAFAANTTPDAKDWIEHIVNSFDNSGDIGEILTRISGDEKKYISDSYDPEHWNPTGPSVEVLSFPHDEMTDTIARLSEVMIVKPAPAPQAQSQPTPGPSPKTTKKSVLSPAMLHTSALFMRGVIDWEKGDIPDALLPPAFNKAFEDAMDNTTIADQASEFKTAWRTTLNPRQKDLLDPLAAVDQDANHVS